MHGYLGETLVNINEHPVYSKYTQSDWAMLYIEMYSGFEGKHHKAWLLDQIARILKGTPVIVKTAMWSNGQREDRYSVSGTTSIKYNIWRQSMLGDLVNGEYEYTYDEGSPP
jgi:hypothetical protein